MAPEASAGPGLKRKKPRMAVRGFGVNQLESKHMNNSSTRQDNANALDRFAQLVQESASNVVQGSEPAFAKSTLIASLVRLGAELATLQERHGCLQRGSVGIALGVAAQLLADEIKSGGWVGFGLDTGSVTAH